MAQNSRRKVQTFAPIMLGGLAAIGVVKAQGQPT